MFRIKLYKKFDLDDPVDIIADNFYDFAAKAEDAFQFKIIKYVIKNDIYEAEIDNQQTFENAFSMYPDLEIVAYPREPKLVTSFKVQNNNKNKPNDFEVEIRADELEEKGKEAFNKGDLEASENLLRESILLRKSIHNPNHPDIISGLVCLGSTLLEQGKLIEATACYQESLFMSRRLHHDKPYHIHIAVALSSLAYAYMKQGNYTEAYTLFHENLEMRRRIHEGHPNHPDIFLTLYHLGTVQYSLENQAVAIKFFEESLEMSQDYYQNTPDQPQIADTLHSLGKAYFRSENHVKAIEFLQKSLQMIRRIHKDHPDDQIITVILYELAAAYYANKMYNEAIRNFQESLDLSRRLNRDGSDIELVSRCLTGLGDSYTNIGNNEKALEYYEECLRLTESIDETTQYREDFRKIIRQFSDPRDNLLTSTDEKSFDGTEESFLQSMAKIRQSFNLPKDFSANISELKNLAKIADKLGRDKEMINFYNEALTILRQKHRSKPWQPDIIFILDHLGSLYERQGNQMEALKAIKEQSDLRDRFFVENPTAFQKLKAQLQSKNVTTERSDRLRSLSTATMSLNTGAKIPSNQSKSVTKPTSKQESYLDVAWSLNNLAAKYQKKGDLDEAVNHYNKALAIFRALYQNKPLHPDLAIVLNSLGAVYDTQGKYSLAVDMFTEVLTIRQNSHKDQPDHPEIVSAITNLANAHAKSGNVGKAVEIIEEFFNNRRMKPGSLAYRKDMAWLLNNLGLIYQSIGNHPECVRAFKESIDMFRRAEPQKMYQPEVAAVYFNLALACDAQNDTDEAIKAFQEHLETIKRVHHEEPAHSEVLTAYEYLERAFEKQGNFDEAIRLGKEALLLRSSLLRTLVAF